MTLEEKNEIANLEKRIEDLKKTEENQNSSRTDIHDPVLSLLDDISVPNDAKVGDWAKGTNPKRVY